VPAVPLPNSVRTVPAVAVVLALVVAAPAAGAIAPATDAGTGDQRDPRVTEHRGDVVAVPLSVGNASDARVRVESAAGPYEADVSLTDADGDGRVELRWNTYLAGHGDAFAAAGEDAASTDDRRPLDGRVAAGNHTLTVTVDGERVDGATVRLEPVPDPSVAALAPLPGRAEAPRSLAEMRSARAAGAVAPADGVGVSGSLVVAVEAPGIEGALAAQNGGNASARFQGLTDSDGFAFSVREDPTTVTTMKPPIRLGVVGAGADVLADPANDTYYVVYDVDEAPRRVDRPHYPEVQADDLFNANVTIGTASGLVAERRTATVEEVRVVEWWVDLDDDAVPYVRPAPDQSLVAATTLPNGSRVTVAVEAGAEMSAQRTVTVADNQITASFNFSSLPRGQALTVRYLVDGEALPTHQWRDRAAAEARVAPDAYGVSVENVTRTGESVRPLSVLVNATVPDDAIVVLHAGAADGPVVGTSGSLSAGTYPRLAVNATRDVGGTEQVVAVVHRDEEWDGQFDGEAPVVVDGRPLAATGSVPAPPTESTTPTASESPTATASPTPASPAGTQSSPTTAPTTTTSPGFGPLAALVAVALVALLARRP
jgi:PGF-CTERM protein